MKLHHLTNFFICLINIFIINLIKTAFFNLTKIENYLKIYKNIIKYLKIKYLPVSHYYPFFFIHY